MKTKVLTIWSIFFLILFIVWSCSKTEDNNSTASKNLVFPTGQPNNNFASGGLNNVFAGNEGGNFNPNEDCAVGTWYVPKSSWSSCNQDYHLKLTFNSGGTGEAWHLDEYLCFDDMHKLFTWRHENDSMFIEYDDQTMSASPFACPATQMQIFWNGNNSKILIRH